MSRDLLNRELIERQIAVIALDHPLSIATRPRLNQILLIPSAVGVSRQVEPAPRPFFSEVEKRADDRPVPHRLRAPVARNRTISSDWR